MNAQVRHPPLYRDRSGIPSAASGTLRVLWCLLRLPTLAVLLALEPFISFLLSAAGILGIAAALVIRASADLPTFPFWGMIAFSVGSLLLLAAYHALISLFAM